MYIPSSIKALGARGFSFCSEAAIASRDRDPGEREKKTSLARISMAAHNRSFATKKNLWHLG